MSIKEQAADALEAGAFVIRGGFWTQGAFARDKFRHTTHSMEPNACYFCTLGALQAQSLKAGVGTIARDALDCWVEERLGFSGAATFNDAPERTADEVADAMEACAAELRVAK